MVHQLSDKAKQLIPKARIVSFDGWQNYHSPESMAIFQQADDEGRYLTNEDLELIQQDSSYDRDYLEVARYLRLHATEIVTEARQQVLSQYPQITEPGGDLHPPARAEACWRDFWHFLRCITYGIAGTRSQFTSKDGLYHMQLLYEELKVPLQAMILGLEAIESSSLAKLNPTQPELFTPYFDHLIAKLRSFQV